MPRIFDQSIPLHTIRTGLAQLTEYQSRMSSTDPRGLAWEIKLYKWILAQPDAEEKAKLYLAARHGNQPGGIVNKRIVVKELNWTIT